MRLNILYNFGFFSSKYDIFCPYAYKKNDTVRSHDLSINYNYLDPSTEWYNSVKVKTWQNVTVVRDGVMYRYVLISLTVSKHLILDIL